MNAVTAAPRLRRLGWTSTCAGALALGALGAGWPRVLAWATRYLSDDHAVTPRGAAQLAVALAAACVSLIAGGWLLARLAANPAARRRLFGATPEQRARAYRALASGWAAAIVVVWVGASFGRDVGIVGEAGVVETIQVLVLVAAALVLARTAVRMGARSARRLTYGLLAVAALLVAGEEASWGQWYFGWQTPDAWAAVNRQGETNLHNLFNAQFEPAYALLGIAAVVYLALSTLLLASRHGGGRFAWLLLPPQTSGPVAAMAIALLRGGLGGTPHWVELEELAAYLMLLLWAHGNLGAVTIASWHAPSADFASTSPPPSAFSSPP